MSCVETEPSAWLPLLKLHLSAALVAPAAHREAFRRQQQAALPGIPELQCPCTPVEGPLGDPG